MNNPENNKSPVHFPEELLPFLDHTLIHHQETEVETEVETAAMPSKKRVWTVDTYRISLPNIEDAIPKGLHELLKRIKGLSEAYVNVGIEMNVKGDKELEDHSVRDCTLYFDPMSAMHCAKDIMDKFENIADELAARLEEKTD